MSSRGTGLTLSLGIVAGFIGYILWQVTIGLNTKVDDVQTILTNSASGSTVLQISVVLIILGLVIHAVGLINTKGTASSTSENIGIVCIVAAIAVWVTSSSLGIALMEMGEKYGVKTRRWRDDQIAVFEKAWNDVVAEDSAKDPVFKRVHESYAKFRKAYAKWGAAQALKPTYLK